MRYTIELPHRPVEVDVQAVGDGRYRVRVGDGEPFEVEADAAPGGVHLRAGDRSFCVSAGARGDGLHVHAGGFDAVLRVLDERARRVLARTGAGFVAEGTQIIRSPMPGKVVAVLVEPGQKVEAGQGVVVIEAMKMENELRADAAGVVAAVHVAPGDRVEGNADLVVLEAGPDPDGPEEAA